MSVEELTNAISQYKEQLKQINTTISATADGLDKDDLINLKADVEQLIQLTEENLDTLQVKQPSTSGCTDALDDEYMLFMQEMEKEGATSKGLIDSDIQDDLKSLEGIKCRAPHDHSWGTQVYHNAMVCGTIDSNDENQSFDEIQVRVMFTNPTHQEMLPCPYFLNGSCKFTDDKCRFSHGQTVLLSSLQEYIEPNFETVKTGSKVLAKRNDNLWHRAIVKNNTDGECTIKYESNQDESIVPIQNVMPLDEQSESESSDSENEDDIDNDWLVQQSLLTTPPSQMLGDWEKYTKGIGSKLMQQMGYIVGNGLGRFSDGRIEPVEAVVLPAGKSLDHCMTLRENAGGDENLFSVEKRLKKLQKQHEIQTKKRYEREKLKTNVFEFLNSKLILSKDKNDHRSKQINKSKHREELKSGSNRDLNVAGLKLEEDIRRTEQEIDKLKESLLRHNTPNTAMNKSLKMKLSDKQAELNRLTDCSQNVRNEQNVRKDKKKMTIF